MPYVGKSSYKACVVCCTKGGPVNISNIRPQTACKRTLAHCFICPCLCLNSDSNLATFCSLECLRWHVANAAAKGDLAMEHAGVSSIVLEQPSASSIVLPPAVAPVGPGHRCHGQVAAAMAEVINTRLAPPADLDEVQAARYRRELFHVTGFFCSVVGGKVGMAIFHNLPVLDDGINQTPDNFCCNE